MAAVVEVFMVVGSLVVMANSLEEVMVVGSLAVMVNSLEEFMVVGSLVVMFVVTMFFLRMYLVLLRGSGFS